MFKQHIHIQESLEEKPPAPTVINIMRIEFNSIFQIPSVA